ncbi:MAG: Rrf2 family transcriptional regulator [Planctomycetes bacterium]|nr:Rrf2 family transcriptional regulator [Planctomycetota bacterium]
MKISKRCQYGLKAVFELSRRDFGQLVKVHEIAAAQNIPVRFLEVILNQLKHAGFVDSRRGSVGGYMLARPAEELTVGEVIEVIEGPVSVAIDDIGNGSQSKGFHGEYAFGRLWRDVNESISHVLDKASFAELVEFERSKREKCVPNYSI